MSYNKIPYNCNTKLTLSFKFADNNRVVNVTFKLRINCFKTESYDSKLEKYIRHMTGYYDFKK